MKKFKNQFPQGDVFFRRVKKLPEGAKKVKGKDGYFVIAHSETGHHHVIKEGPGVTFYETDNPMTSYLEVVEATEQTEVFIEHLRAWDTHESVKFSVGLFQIQKQREYTPEGWRKASD